MASLRSSEMVNKYNEHQKTGVLARGCPLCDTEPLKIFKYWKIIENDFPYDLIAKTHHMIVPIRHEAEKDLTEEELAELGEIKENYINQGYDYIIEPTVKNKSIPGHFHLHLIIGK